MGSTKALLGGEADSNKQTLYSQCHTNSYQQYRDIHYWQYSSPCRLGGTETYSRRLSEVNGVRLVRLRVCVLYKDGMDVYILPQMNLVAVPIDWKGSPRGELFGMNYPGMCPTTQLFNLETDGRCKSSVTTADQRNNSHGGRPNHGLSHPYKFTVCSTILRLLINPLQQGEQR